MAVIINSDRFYTHHTSRESASLLKTEDGAYNVWDSGDMITRWSDLAAATADYDARCDAIEKRFNERSTE